MHNVEKNFESETKEGNWSAINESVMDRKFSVIDFNGLQCE